jgi:hypothetical protein
MKGPARSLSPQRSFHCARFSLSSLSFSRSYMLQTYGKNTTRSHNWRGFQIRSGANRRCLSPFP